MAGKLIQHLKEKSGNHPNIKLLQTQWEYDEFLIPKALQNIVSIFPHFSRHDSSHSIQILINIERLLGDALKLLSATDTWLLLEAAYWHDIGMIITSKDIETDIKSDEFKQYINNIASQSEHELNAFAKQFYSLDPKNCFAAADTPQRAVELYRQLLASWYRSHHQSRAAAIVDDPFGKAGIASPRNELIPMRLFRILGQICKSHGSSFDSLIESLPFCEAGMATEDCHPRFIACLLRLGDLFDLDNNRFCPVMLQVAGEMSASTQAHFDKHASIRHFRLDPDRIEITAECDGYDSYEATDQWFRWIEDELRCQMTRWKEIVPLREFGLLPTLGKLEVNLAPPNMVIDAGQRPAFGIDTQKTFELLQGAGIYSDKFQSIRELLQNAVDATLIRIWLSHCEVSESENESIDWDDPYSEKIRTIFDRYPIKVSLFKCSEVNDGHVTWQLEICDHGIGISKNDIKYMKSIGGSSKNIIKKAVIEKMPKWMRPSGAFGIGLQSAFLISPEVNFESKSIFTGESLKVKAMSPIGPQRGLIYLENSKQPAGKRYGTLLSLKFNTPAVVKQISRAIDDFLIQPVLNNFDPVRMDVLDYDSTRIVQEISKFAHGSIININLKYNRATINYAEPVFLSGGQRPYYDQQTGIALFLIRFEATDFVSSSIDFRGQEVKEFRPRIDFVACHANILFYNAADVLTINRNNIKDSKQQYVFGQLIKTISNYLRGEVPGSMKPEEFDKLDDQQKAAASAFLLIYEEDQKKNDLKENWTSLYLPEIGRTIYEFCCNENPCLYLSEGNNSKYNKTLTFIDSHQINEPHYQLLLRYCNDNKFFIHQSKEEGWIGSKLSFTKDKKDPFSDEYLRTLLLFFNTRSKEVGGRVSLPVWDKYINLSSHTERLTWCRPLSDCHRFMNHFVLPFFFDTNHKKVTTDGLEELCEWTMKNAYQEGQTISEILKLYEEFIAYIDTIVMAGDEKWVKLRGNHK